MFQTYEPMSDIQYVLEFAKYVIEDNELENTKSSGNIILGEMIDKEIEKIKSTNTESVPCNHLFKVNEFNVKCVNCGREFARFNI